MALKVKVDNEDQDTVKVNIPLFSTVEEAVKDIKIDNTTVKINIQKEHDDK